MSIVEFLLARIAEDQGMIRPETLGSGDWAPGAGGLYWRDQHGSDEICIELSRLTAECEARRQIVALHTDDALWCDSGGYDPGITHAEAYVAYPTLVGPCATLRLLALPYSGHEDYDKGWRP